MGQFRWNNVFNFNNTFGGSFSAYWETGTRFMNYSWHPVGSFMASLWKTFLKDKIRLSAVSCIWAKGRKSTTYSDDYTSMYYNKTKPTSFSFTLTYFLNRGNKVKERMKAESIQQYNKVEETK